MRYTFGLIGSGNMGGAIARAVSLTLKDGILADHSPQRAQELAAELGFSSGTNEDATRESQYLFLGVKPHLMGGMPNTPVAVREGVVLYETSANVTADMMDGFLNMMSQAGKLFHLEESLMDVGAAVSGCGPAYAYLILDAMADGGVACGLPRPDAVRFAAQTLLGAAQMVLETGKHPDQLKNDVCSPGGSTIQGVRTLEQRAVRAAVMDAVIAACEKNAALGK